MHSVLQMVVILNSGLLLAAAIPLGLEALAKSVAIVALGLLLTKAEVA